MRTVACVCDSGRGRGHGCLPTADLALDMRGGSEACGGGSLLDDGH
jgi:hypothetical protein